MGFGSVGSVDLTQGSTEESRAVDAELERLKMSVQTELLKDVGTPSA